MYFVFCCWVMMDVCLGFSRYCAICLLGMHAVTGWWACLPHENAVGRTCRAVVAEPPSISDCAVPLCALAVEHRSRSRLVERDTRNMGRTGPGISNRDGLRKRPSLKSWLSFAPPAHFVTTLIVPWLLSVTAMIRFIWGSILMMRLYDAEARHCAAWAERVLRARLTRRAKTYHEEGTNRTSPTVVLEVGQEPGPDMLNKQG